jgi:hypothetical protein
MSMQPDVIPVTYRPPFAFGARPWRDVRPHGETILQIVQSVPDLPPWFMSKGTVCVNGEPVPRNLWPHVRPKAATEAIPVVVTLHWAPGNPGGGGGNTRKSIVGLVAAIALVAVATAISGGALTPESAALTGVLPLGAGSIGAHVLAGAVTIAGALAIAALTKPPTTASPLSGPDNSENLQPASVSQNVVAPGGSIPRVVGLRKVYPPVVMGPVVEQLNDLDEQVSVVLALNGPHNISNIMIDGVDVTSASDVSVEIKNGESTDTALTTILKQGKINAPNISLTQHVLDATGVKLATQSLTNDLPKWHRFVTPDSADDILIQLLLPAGVANISGGVYMAVPFRMRFRLYTSGTPNPWNNIPEFHLVGLAPKQQRRQIRLRWGVADTGTAAVISTGTGFFYATGAPPPQTITPATPGSGDYAQWVAHAQWRGSGPSPTGDEYLYSANPFTTRLGNINFSQNWQLDFLMQTPTQLAGGLGFPKGKYEIEIMRGAAYPTSTFSPTAYTLGGILLDMFYANGTAPNLQTTNAQTNYSSATILNRCCALWNSNPVPGSGGGLGKFALIALVARNRAMQRISCYAAGRVSLLSGGVWGSGPTLGAGYNSSSNPAAHFRDVLIGASNHDPLPSTLVDDAGLQSWYNLCASRGWNVNAVIDDMRTQDTLDLFASCGYARPYQSDLYGVIVDSDHSGQSPIQVFSHANTANMQFTKAFARVPIGLIVNFSSTANDYESDQSIINQTTAGVGTTGLYETVTYDGLVTATEVNARAKFDLDQANLRNVFYTFDCDMEAIVCRRGDLVAIQHDILEDAAGAAHVKTVNKSGSNIISLVLSSIVTTAASTAVAIRCNDGTILTKNVTNAGDTNTVTFSTPFADPGTIKGFDDTADTYGCLVVVGSVSTVYKRMLVQNIQPKQDLQCTVTLVDEAPSLVRL